MTCSRHRIVAIVVTATVLVTAACSGDPAVTETVAVTPSTTAPTSPSPTPSSPSPTASPTASPTPASSPSASPSPTATAAPLVAEPTGLRLVSLGDAEADAMAEMRARFGDPDADTGWVPAANSPFGVCPGATSGAQVRGVRWGQLRLLFSDAGTDHGNAGTKHLMAYDLTSFEGSGSTPTTSAGIGLGSTTADLQAAYGSDVSFHAADEVQPDRFTIDFGSSGQISGSLDAPPPDGTVTFLTAGMACGE